MVETIEPEGPQIREEEPVNIIPNEPDKAENDQTRSNLLDYQADERIRNYFEKYFHSIHPGSQADNKIIASLAPRLITLRPGSVSSSNKLYSDLSEIPEQFLLYVLDKQTRGLASNYFSKENLQKGKIRTFFPEANAIKTIARSNLRGHPYMVVMAMQPHLRDVPALAVKENFKPFQTDKYDDNPFTKISLATPSLQDILQVANKYNVSEINEVLKDLNRASNLFYKEWNNGSA